VTYVEAARKLAERMLSEGGSTAEDRIRYAYRLLLARSPQPRELDLIRATLDQFRLSFGKDQKAALAFVKHGESGLNPALDLTELAAYTGIASLILNLDESITKE